MEDSPTETDTPSKSGARGILLRAALPIILLIVGWVAFDQLSEEEPPKERPKRERPMLETHVVEVHPGPYEVELHTQGIVGAVETASVTSQINGQISRFSSDFEPGAFVSKGEVLAEIDPVDFEAALATSQASLAQAEAALAQEEARARQARRNWEELDFSEDPSPLVLREPQLKETQARLKAAQADLKQAELALERTKIRAPFDGIVLERTVGIGERVGSSSALGILAATDQAEVRLPLSPRQLAMLEDDVIKNRGTVALTDALNPDLVTTQWSATLLRAEGRVDEVTREVFVIARIDDPFGLESGERPLRIGQPVRATFKAKTFENVVAIPRAALRDLDQVIEVKDGKVKKETITPIWSTDQELIVRGLFESGAKLAISNLPFAPEGSAIRIIEEHEELASTESD